MEVAIAERIGEADKSAEQHQLEWRQLIDEAEKRAAPTIMPLPNTPSSAAGRKQRLHFPTSFQVIPFAML